MGYCRKIEKKLPLIHANTLEGVSSTGPKPHPSPPVTELKPLLAQRQGPGWGRRICGISRQAGCAHPDLHSELSQPGYWSNTNGTGGGGDAQPGLHPIHSWDKLSERGVSMPKSCLNEHQASRTTVLPEELVLLPTGPSSPTLLGDAADCQAPRPHHTS